MPPLLTRAAISLLLTLQLQGCSESPPPSGEQVTAISPVSVVTTPDAEALKQHNRAVGLMGRFAYADAQALLAQLVARYPNHPELKCDLAIATLNRQQEGDEDEALRLFAEVLADYPDHLRAHYGTGLLELHAGNLPAAAAHFEMVAKADPGDAHARYFLAQIADQQGEREAALAGYQQSIELDPYLRSGYYGAFRTARVLGRRELAASLMANYQRLDGNPQARLAEFKYTRMGPKAEVRPLLLPPVQSRLPDGELFATATRLAALTPPESASSLTVADVNGDGLVDLSLTRADANGQQPNLILIATSANSWESSFTPPWAEVGAINAALWGDLNNDGLLDLYLCRSESSQLWQGTLEGGWQEIGQQSGVAEGDCRNGRLFDADHDGDLDLLRLTASGAVELLNNNLDGSYRLLEGEVGPGAVGPIAQLAVADFDRDRDLDLLLLGAEGVPQLRRNDRLWAYSAEGMDQASAIRAALFDDRDADGYPELLTQTTDGQLTLWHNRQGSEWQPERLERVANADGRMALADLDGDGLRDLLLSTSEGLFVKRTGGLESIIKGKIHAFSPLHNDPQHGPSLVAWVGDQLLLLPPGEGRFPFTSFTFSGREASAESMRSNASGIGARAALRVGARWSLFDYLPSSNLPGQSLQPESIGLGGAGEADFLAITWPDGVFQSELELSAGELHAISETQRQLSSCPVLYVWDGEKYRFVSDLLGVGGIGFTVAPGEYAPSRPWENFQLEQGLMQPSEGRYRLKIGEPMEEAAYLDEVRLVRWAVPPGWQMVLDERMGILDPQPTGKARFYRHAELPIAAHDAEGNSLMTELAEADGAAAGVGELDLRFIGRLKQENVVTLEFANAFGDRSGSPMLVIDGWIEYPYSQTIFAAWQANATFDAPTIEAQDSTGIWHLLAEQIGYPAGMPRRMSLPLDGLPVDGRRLRIRTNLEVYWDRIQLAYAEQLPEAQRHEFALLHAEQREVGYPLRSTYENRRPHYDYGQRAPLWDTRYMPGYYSELGEVTELVAAYDDAVAIIGPGEEVHFEFSAQSAPLPDGWSSYLVLESRGWAKDMDLFTGAGETLGPLPRSGQADEPRRSLHEKYLTRYRSGY